MSSSGGWRPRGGVRDRAHRDGARPRSSDHCRELGAPHPSPRPACGLRTVAPHCPAGGVLERLIDRSLDFYDSVWIAPGTHELLDSRGRFRPVDRQALPDGLLAGVFVLTDERRIVPGDQFRPNVRNRHVPTTPISETTIARDGRVGSANVDLASSIAAAVLLLRTGVNSSFPARKVR